jgi:hypothetical protein
MTSGLSKERGPLLIPELFEAGVIPEPVFGFYLTDTENESFVDIGYLRPSAMRDTSELVWIDTE